ncbi:hypothetical protein K7X08_029807 [Anisodus acutangulus]|uniref:Uncharacterized protein n=1 Tax=Anisodus acutangulus TaxID=402998 RepID=A0A9Q1RHW8_9SOLA|nr:hypothetical protein K7X08_029807 [Anisodus acutangulus]
MAKKHAFSSAALGAGQGTTHGDSQAGTHQTRSQIRTLDAHQPEVMNGEASMPNQGRLLSAQATSQAQAQAQLNVAAS